MYKTVIVNYSPVAKEMAATSKILPIKWNKKDSCWFRALLCLLLREF